MIAVGPIPRLKEPRALPPKEDVVIGMGAASSEPKDSMVAIVKTFPSIVDSFIADKLKRRGNKLEIIFRWELWAWRRFCH